MPWKSKAQEAYLAINKPAVAKKFAAKSPSSIKGLPQHVGKVKVKLSPKGV
jgi:hypothetical protein